MWLFLPFGFYSIVKKPGDTLLTIRARAKTDLDNLRTHVPELGPIVVGTGSDYPYRCQVDPVKLAIGLGNIIQMIDYDNFKHAVAVRHDNNRARLYSRVWATLLDMEE